LIGGLAEATGDIENGSFFEEGYHPSHLHNGMDCFGGGRWDIYLGSLGLEGGREEIFVRRH
jgi:hypothetical protein